MIISIPCGIFLTMYWDPWTPDLGTFRNRLEMMLREAISRSFGAFQADSIEHMMTLKAMSSRGECLENSFDATNGFFTFPGVTAESRSLVQNGSR